MSWKAVFENPRAYIYQWSWSGLVDPASVDGIRSGTLKEAIEAAQNVAPSLPGPASQTVITLYDSAGFKRGWVKGDGNWSLT